jgi:hypothetical protein
MPYYVYAVKPFAQLEKRAEFASFREASACAKKLRAAAAEGEPARIKLMFADNERVAEDLLLQVRVAGPTGDE